MYNINVIVYDEREIDVIYCGPKKKIMMSEIKTFFLGSFFEVLLGFRTSDFFVRSRVENIQCSTSPELVEFVNSANNTNYSNKLVY